MPVSDLTASAQDYLKVIWSATEWSGTPVTVGMMAARLGVSASTASEGIRKLSNQGLVSHARYGSIELTAAGREHAVAMVRRHRFLRNPPGERGTRDRYSYTAVRSYSGSAAVMGGTMEITVDG
jgi:hypothetical protein